MKTDEWVTTALGDEAVVAEFLLRLRHSTAAPAALAWGSRRERSKPAVKKDRDSMMRCSPTTPLSWSCGAASEDSSRPSDLSSASRSKGTYANDSIACNWANTPSKRKKSFTELQGAETLLLKGTHLKTEFETSHVTLKKQQVNSENLIRLETDVHQQPAFGVATKPYYAEGLNFRQANGANCSRTDYAQASNDINMHKDHVVTATVVKAEKSFFLPDLNMPFEDDSTFDSLNGFS